MKQKFKTLPIALFLIMASLLSGCETVAIVALNQIPLTQMAARHDKLYLLGTLNSKSLSQFKQIIAENPKIKTIVFTANDGSIDDETTFKLGRLIRQMQLDTHLLHNSVIASGAVDLFLAGVNRSIEEGAKVGVHSWSDGIIQAKDLPKDHPDHRLNADYLADMMGNEDFYWYTIYAANADEILWMPQADILRYELVKQFAEPTVNETPFKGKFIDYRAIILEEG